MLYSKTPQISSIRVAKDGQKQRIVIDIEGQKERSFYIKKDKGIISITIEALLDPKKTDEFKALIEKMNYIEGVSFISLDKEAECVISLFLNKKDKIADQVFSLPDPSRIVIDIERSEYQ